MGVAETWDVVRDLAESEIDASTALNQLCQFIAAEDPLVSTIALRRAVFIADASSHYDTVGKELAESLQEGKYIGFSLTQELHRFCKNGPAGLEPILPHLEQIINNEDRAGVSVFTAGATLGLIGSQAPGLARRSVPTLVEGIDVNRETDEFFGTTREALEIIEIICALARLGVTEPAVVRPFVAEQVAGLTADK